MTKPITLNSENLPLLPPLLKRPLYQREKLTSGIYHIGVGGFHRSHQAYYTDELAGLSGGGDWGICGIGLLDRDRIMKQNLERQDYLYTLVVNKPDGTSTARIIGSITGFLFAPDDPEAVIEKLAHPSVKIVSLTITEGGYNYDQSTGEFDFNNADIQWDIKNPSQPVTVFGFLSESLRRRMERGMTAFTLMSCDNIQHNGDVARKMLLTFTAHDNSKLATWIENNVCFPNCMVDRITPAATEADKSVVSQRFGIDDNCPVMCEPFCQWVIEDKFSSGRPDWEKAGAQFVPDVSPFEKMKIRLLNAGHSLLGLSGALHGYLFIHEAVGDMLFADFLRRFMDEEVTPVLDPVPGIDLESYKDSLFERFGNSLIRDKVSRICLQSSAKIPKFLLPTITDQLKADGPVGISAFIIASWCRYAEGADEAGNKYPIEDEMKAILHEAALRSRHDPAAFLKIKPVFGDLSGSAKFVDAYSFALQGIYRNGVKLTMKDIISRQT